MNEEINSWKLRFQRERKSRKESELLLENKSRELWEINQDLEKQVNERTDSLKNALEKAQKADDAKSTFLANMSHEIRTPLNAILGFSDLLTNAEELTGQHKKQAEIINSSANNLLTIINDILDISKIESGNFEISIEKINLQFICEHTVELFSKNAIEKNIRLFFTMDPNIPNCVITDGVRIRQVISNILSNAIKFTPSYGVITFSIEEIEKNEDETFLRFEIVDSGIGIAPDQLELVFKPFMQIDHKSNRQFQGTGLGLSICSYIINAFDSKMNVESSVGSGAKFWFDLKLKTCVNDYPQKEYLSNINFKINDNENNAANENDLYLSIKDYLNIFGTINDKTKKTDLLILAYSNKNKETFELIRKENENLAILILFEYEDDLIKFKSNINEEKISLPFYTSKINDSITELLRKSDVLGEYAKEEQNISTKVSFDAKLLIAEDNIANQELISYILEELGIDFVIKSNGEEVLEAFKKEEFDMVLMDINMPVLDGVSAFNYIREYEEEKSLDKTPIIALTANAIKGDKEKFLNLGMDDYLSKPINTNELIHIFKKYLNTQKISNKIMEIDLEKIKNKLGISDTIVNLIVKKFKENIQNDLQELENYILEENLEQIREKAHYIKNSCLNICLDDAVVILQSMETKIEDINKLNKSYKKLENLLKNLD